MNLPSSSGRTVTFLSKFDLLNVTFESLVIGYVLEGRKFQSFSHQMLNKTGNGIVPVTYEFSFCFWWFFCQNINLKWKPGRPLAITQPL